MPSTAAPIVATDVAPWSARLARPLFSAALFASAFLLFGVQPMFAKMVLPVLGGSPAVWSVATVVFQCLLLAGYAYAQALSRRSTRTALLVHLALVAAAAATLPIALRHGWGPAPAGGEAGWLVALMLASIGLPFFAVAANGPLLQSWFARTAHRDAKDPYFLYAASNIGSFAALAAYPLLIESAWPLRDQSRYWALGFAGLAVMIAGAGMLAARGRPAGAAAPAVPSAAPTWRERLMWVALASVPSGLLVAATAHLSTDIAAIPLLWAVPLGIYLLSFVLAFRPAGRFPDRLIGLPLVGLTAVALAGLGGAGSLWLGLGIHLGLFALTTLICHRALYLRRPRAEHLTNFYLSLSAGGALGGLFAGLVAPALFSSVLEYPILLVAALLCRPAEAGRRSGIRREVVRTVLAAAACLGLAVAALACGAPDSPVRQGLLIALAVLLIVGWRSKAASVAACLSLALAATTFHPGTAREENIRSFFGIHKIITSADGRFRLLAHGTTAHGAMRIRNDDGSPALGRPEPTTYYGLDGAIGSAIASVREAHGGRLRRVSVVGLGTGSLACHSLSGEVFIFYEIDREVIRIARDTTKFRFLGECAPDQPVVLGDARLTLAESQPGQDLILLDAFSSDSIPTHLVTREAIGLYLTKLAPDGALVMHLSNRHLDLRRVVARAAADHGLLAWTRTEHPAEPFEKRMRSGAMVVAMARQARDLGPLAAGEDWQRLEPDMSRRPWTDDYSNVIEALMDAYRR
ncbi:spermidine synthase [uncultured Enterovirga sp.]|uniref:spermidine synthase n=1 Tax=uncultured Enterovirga sp. TaxID=2026352 RepID=UPI0035CC42B4